MANCTSLEICLRCDRFTVLKINSHVGQGRKACKRPDLDRSHVAVICDLSLMCGDWTGRQEESWEETMRDNDT